MLKPQTGSHALIPITGRSMFYGLLAIAANSMSQPTGRICDTPAHINAQLRISPIECAVDTLLMIGRFLYYSSSEGFRTGATILISQRFFNDDNNSGQLHNLQSNSAWRIIVGVITIYSSVKIFCSQNVVLTKVWAGIYIAHWIFGEILIFVKERMKVQQVDADRHRDKTPPSHGPKSVAWIVVVFAALFPLHFGALGISGLAKSKGLNWSPIQCIGLVVLVFGCIPFTAASLYAMQDRGTRTLRSCSLPLLAVLPLGLVYLLPLAIKAAAQLHETHPHASHALTAILAGIWVSGGVLWAARTLLVAPEQVDGEPPVQALIANREFTRCLETWLTWWLVATHIVSAWLFYTYGYDTQTKVRPWWSEYLG